ncbi:MAG: radical SAM protein [Vicinamibacteraceae bacterium]
MLPFDTVAGQQPDWDHRVDLTPGLPVVQVFTATEDELSRIEVFLVPDADGADSGLRFSLWEGGDADAIAGEPLRASRSGPVPIHGRGWFSFDFTPLAASRGRVYTLGIEATGGVGLMAHRGLGSRLKIAGRGVKGSIAFRAVARRAPALGTHFDQVRDSIAAQQTRLDQGPLHVRLEIASSCNLACIMCPFGAPGGYGPADGIRFMTLDVFKAVEPMLSRALTVNAFGLGEPFLSPHFMPILRRSRALNADAVVFCSTNGVTYSERTITAVVAERLVNVLQISVDGATKETYEHVRVGGRFDQLMKNLRFLQAEKARLRARVPSTKIQMVIMRPNMHEVVGVTRAMIDLGIDVLRLDTVKDHPELEITSHDDVRRLNDQLQEAIRLCTSHRVSIEGTLLTEIEPMLDESAAREGIARPKPLVRVIPLVPDEASRTHGAGMPVCTAPWESFTLGANGEVRLCCHYQKVMGSTLKASFEDVWNGQTYLDVRESLCTGHYEDLCARCLETSSFMPDQEIRGVYRERRVESAPLAAIVPDAWASAKGRHLDDLRDAMSATAAGHATVRCAALFDGIAASAQGPVDLRGELRLAATPSGDARVAVVVGGVVADVVVASPQGRGRWSWQAVADARLFVPGAAIDVWLVDAVAGRLSFAPLVLDRPGLTALGSGPLGSTVVHTAAGAAIPLVSLTASPLIGQLDPVVTDDRSIRIEGWALDWRLAGPGTVIGVFADGRFVDEVAPWIERPDVADVLKLDPKRGGSSGWARFQKPDTLQPEWLCTGFFIDLPVAVAPWLADAHIQVIQVSRALGLATEVEYGRGYPFGPRPMPVAIGVGAGIRPVVR